MDAGEEVGLAERLGEIANYARLESVLPRPFIRKGSNQNGGNGLTGTDFVWR